MAAVAEGFKLTKKQRAMNQMVAGDSVHNMAYGGSRSGKTFNWCRGVAVRAIAAPGSRHGIARYRFAHLKASVVNDTWPTMLRLCFPGLDVHLDKQDYFAAIRRGRREDWSEVWFMGLDDKDRTEKVLGQEFATLFLNECSQIPWASRNTVLTRLAQKVIAVNGEPLRLKMLYDCNPPSKAHWTYQAFIEKINPDGHLPWTNPNNFSSIILNPEDNRENLSDEYIGELENMSTKDRNRFLYGLFAEIDDYMLWYDELLDQQRKLDGYPDMQRIVVAIDPSGASGPEDKRSDEIGIIVAGLGTDGCAYILEDLTIKASPETWGTIAVSAFDRWDADLIVGETNFGGEMVAMVIRATVSGMEERGERTSRKPVPFRKITATRGKVLRAEPISTLYEQQKVWHTNIFTKLEREMTAASVTGYTGDRSPNRMDAMVFAVTELFPAVSTATKQQVHRPQVQHSRPDVRKRSVRR